MENLVAQKLTLYWSYRNCNLLKGYSLQKSLQQMTVHCSNTRFTDKSSSY